MLNGIIDRDEILEKLYRLNKNLLFIVFLIFTIGLTMLYSTGSGNFAIYAKKQLLIGLFFTVIMIVIALVDANIIYRYAYLIYSGGLALLLVVELMGYTSMGATRWINLGIIRLQPSELMKISLIVALARYFQGKNLEDIRQNKTLFMPLFLFVVPFALILKQPNLGTAMILLCITVIILFCVGVQYWKFILCLILGLSAIPFVWKYGLHDYQKQRVMTFLNPQEDPLKSGYNIIQSKIAIGSGGIWGKGLLNGTQSQLEFLPEKHTDFIFTVLAEEFGFIGSIATLICYTVMLGFMVYFITIMHHTFGRVIITGIAANLFLHLFINVGMIMGLLPVVGTPLPLLSYGGSITAATFISMGFVLNMHLNKNEELRLN